MRRRSLQCCSPQRQTSCRREPSRRRGHDEQAVQGRRQHRHQGLDPGLGALHPADRTRGRAERALRRPRRRRLLGHGAVRRPDRDAQHQAHRRPGPDLHELPYDGAVLPDPVLPADGAQPHHERHGVHHRGNLRLPERERPRPVRMREPRRGARRARLEHLHRRQVASLRRGRDEPRLVQAPVAARPRLRALLRVSRRRDEPVVPGPRLRQPSRRTTEVARGGLPPHGRSHRQGDRVRSGREGDRTGQAVLPLLLPGGSARAPPRLEGVGRPVQGHVRHGLRGLPGARVRAAEEARHRRRGSRAVADRPVRRHDEPRRQAVVAGRPRQALGLAHRRREAALRTDGRGLCRFPQPRRPRAGAPARLPREQRPAREHDRRARLRQRCLGRGRAERLGQREQVLQRGPRHDRGEPRASRRPREHAHVQPLPHRLGVGVQHSFQVVEALCELRGRHRRPAHRLVAGRDRGDRRDSPPVQPRRRHRADPVRVSRRRAPGRRQRLHAEADRGRQLQEQPRRAGSAVEGDAVLLDARHPGDLAQGLEGRHRGAGCAGVVG